MSPELLVCLEEDVVSKGEAKTNLLEGWSASLRTAETDLIVSQQSHPERNAGKVMGDKHD